MGHRRIILETIDYDKARIPGQIGDWRYDENGDLIIQVVAQEVMPNVHGDILMVENTLIAIHELAEALTCRAAGIEQEAVDEFDKNFVGNSEAGDHHDSPYRKQHRFSMLIEHLFAHEMGISGHGRME